MKLEIINKLEEKIRDNGPSILTGLGVIGLISTVGLAIKATHEFDKEKYETTEKKFKAILRHYYPVFIFGAGSIACIIGSNTINMKRNLALAGAYKLSEDRLIRYKNRLFGTTEEQNDDKVKQNVMVFGSGEVDCYDQLSGRYFRSSLDNIKEAVDNINRMIYGGDSPELSDFYTWLDLESPEICEDMRWDVDEGPIRLILGSKLDEKSRAILIIDFDIRPTNSKIY